jgi:hypothetical protein
MPDLTDLNIVSLTGVLTDFNPANPRSDQARLLVALIGLRTRPWGRLLAFIWSLSESQITALGLFLSLSEVFSAFIGRTAKDGSAHYDALRDLFLRDFVRVSARRGFTLEVDGQETVDLIPPTATAIFAMSKNSQSIDVFDLVAGFPPDLFGHLLACAFEDGHYSYQYKLLNFIDCWIDQLLALRESEEIAEMFRPVFRPLSHFLFGADRPQQQARWLFLGLVRAGVAGVVDIEEFLDDEELAEVEASPHLSFYQLTGVLLTMGLAFHATKVWAFSEFEPCTFRSLIYCTACVQDKFGACDFATCKQSHNASEAVFAVHIQPRPGQKPLFFVRLRRVCPHVARL